MAEVAHTPLGTSCCLLPKATLPNGAPVSWPCSRPAYAGIWLTHSAHTSTYCNAFISLPLAYLCVVQPASPLRPVLPCHTRSGAPAVRDAQVLTSESPHGSRSPLPPLLGRWPSSLPYHALLLLPYSQWEPEKVLQWYVH